METIICAIAILATTVNFGIAATYWLALWRRRNKHITALALYLSAIAIYSFVECLRIVGVDVVDPNSLPNNPLLLLMRLLLVMALGINFLKTSWEPAAKIKKSELW